VCACSGKFLPRLTLLQVSCALFVQIIIYHALSMAAVCRLGAVCDKEPCTSHSA